VSIDGIGDRVAFKHVGSILNFSYILLLGNEQDVHIDAKNMMDIT
jgi:hypothetical protein